MKFLRKLIITIVLAVAVYLAGVYILNPVTISGHSMDPTLKDQDTVLMIKPGKIKRFDVVISTELDNNIQSKDIVKRVIGLPGDIVAYDHDKLTINGKVYNEPYLENYKNQFAKDKLQSSYAYSSEFQNKAEASPAFTVDSSNNPTFEVTVPDGQYYLLGDNRLVSQDSRQVGTFLRSDLLGRAKLRIAPIKEFKIIK